MVMVEVVVTMVVAMVTVTTVLVVVLVVAMVMVPATAAMTVFPGLTALVAAVKRTLVGFTVTEMPSPSSPKTRPTVSSLCCPPSPALPREPGPSRAQQLRRRAFRLSKGPTGHGEEADGAPGGERAWLPR